MQRVVFSGNCNTLSLKVRSTAKQQQQQQQQQEKAGLWKF